MNILKKRENRSKKNYEAWFEVIKKWMNEHVRFFFLFFKREFPFRHIGSVTTRVYVIFMVGMVLTTAMTHLSTHLYVIYIVIKLTHLC